MYLWPSWGAEVTCWSLKCSMNPNRPTGRCAVDWNWQINAYSVFRVVKLSRYFPISYIFHAAFFHPGFWNLSRSLSLCVRLSLQAFRGFEPVSQSCISSYRKPKHVLTGEHIYRPSVMFHIPPLSSYPAAACTQCRFHLSSAASQECASSRDHFSNLNPCAWTAGGLRHPRNDRNMKGFKIEAKALHFLPF